MTIKAASIIEMLISITPTNLGLCLTFFWSFSILISLPRNLTSFSLSLDLSSLISPFVIVFYLSFSKILLKPKIQKTLKIFLKT